MGSQLDTQALADLHRLREQRDAAETRCGELVEALVTSESKLKSLREVAACTSCGDEFEQRSRPHCRNCYACQEEGCAVAACFCDEHAAESTRDALQSQATQLSAQLGVEQGRVRTIKHDWHWLTDEDLRFLQDRCPWLFTEGEGL